MIKKISLKYRSQKAKDPIIASIIKESGLLLNILYAQFGTNGGEILISVDASEPEIKKIVDSFKNRGVEVSEIKRAIKLDHELCFDCGACVSQCPTAALFVAHDKSIDLDEDKCIYCELCIPSCPVHALKLSKF